MDVNHQEGNEINCCWFRAVSCTLLILGEFVVKKWDHMRNGGTFFWDSVSSRTMSKKTFTQNGEQSGLQNHVVAAGAVVVRGVL